MSVMSGGYCNLGASHAGVQVHIRLGICYEGILRLINGEAAYPYQAAFV